MTHPIEELARRGKNVSHPEEYDVVVLGSGRARFLAWSLASQGKRVVVVERRNLAGSCPTIDCAPSKNVIHGAKVANYFRRGAEFGIAAGDWKVEMPAVRRVTPSRRAARACFPPVYPRTQGSSSRWRSSGQEPTVASPASSGQRHRGQDSGPDHLRPSNIVEGRGR